MLTLLARTLREGVMPDDIKRQSGEGLLFDTVEVKPEPALAEKVERAIRRRVGGRNLREAYFALSTEEPEVDFAVWQYLEQLWTNGPRAARDLAHPSVSRVFHAARKAAREFEKWIGVTRFQETGSVFYAAVAPSCDLLVLLAEHFAQRLPDNWFLHDVKRRKGAIHGRGQWMVIGDLPDARLPDVTEQERMYQALWQEFCQSVAIRERANPRCQMNFLPKRLWRYLIESPDGQSRPATTLMPEQG